MLRVGARDGGVEILVVGSESLGYLAVGVLKGQIAVIGDFNSEKSTAQDPKTVWYKSYVGRPFPLKGPVSF